LKDNTALVGTLLLSTGSITDSSGAIDFADENLVTTGTLGAGATTVTTLTVNTSFAGSAFLDEDNMSSDSDTSAASQQSIKAYVDASGTSVGILMFYGAQ
jgi:hypothetical protein